MELKMRPYFSYYHLWSAKHFAELCKSVEDKYSNELIFRHDQRAYAINAIFSIVAFVEAAINELYIDAVDDYTNYLEGLACPTLSRLKEYWIKTKREEDTITKYNQALICAGKSQMNTGVEPYQSIRYIIKLRNELTHYKPLTMGVNDKSDLHKYLINKFPHNRLISPNAGNSFFPDKCLGYGCAEWSITNCERFVDDFYNLLGTKPNYQINRSREGTEYHVKPQEIGILKG